MPDEYKTIEQLRKEIEDNPQDAMAHYNLATNLPPEQKEESLRLYKRALELDTEKKYSSIVHFNLAVIARLHERNLDAAIEEFEAAAKNLPTLYASEELKRECCDRVHYHLGYAYFERTQKPEHYGKEQEDMQKVAENFREALRYNPNDVTTRKNLRNIENMISQGWLITNDKKEIIKFFAGDE